MHPVIHVSLFEPVVNNPLAGQKQPAPLPIIVDDNVEFEAKWENMGNISAGHLKPELKDFGKLLQYLNINELAKKELLLATFPIHIMKYSQLVQNMRIKTDYTYGDLHQERN